MVFIIIWITLHLLCLVSSQDDKIAKLESFDHINIHENLGQINCLLSGAMFSFGHSLACTFFFKRLSWLFHWFLWSITFLCVLLNKCTTICNSNLPTKLFFTHFFLALLWILLSVLISSWAPEYVELCATQQHNLFFKHQQLAYAWTCI